MRWNTHMPIQAVRNVGAKGARYVQQAQRRQRTLKSLSVALIVCCAACAGALFPAVTQSQSAVALACGIGNTPTMLANATPALLYPITQNTNSNATSNAFSLYYVVGKPITFNEDLSAMIGAPAKSSLQFKWDFGDGTPDSYGASPTHTFAKAGVYLVNSYINSDGWQPFDDAQIHVQAATFANPPLAKATASGNVIGPNGTISFSAAGSHSQDGSTLTYFWDFNDGTTATGPTVKHVFPALPGKWVIALIVTDGRGARSVATVNIQIVASLPTAAISPSLTTVGTGASVTFDASQSTPPSDPPNDQLVQYSWDFGDGTPFMTTQTPTVTHIFKRAGTFTVTVRAIDQQGAAGSKSITISVIAVNSDNGGPPSWLKFGGLGLLVIALLAGGYFLYVNQRNRAALIREREAALELARARRVRSGQPQRPYPPRNAGYNGLQPRGPGQLQNPRRPSGSQTEQRPQTGSAGVPTQRQQRPPASGRS